MWCSAQKERQVEDGFVMAKDRPRRGIRARWVSFVTTIGRKFDVMIVGRRVEVSRAVAERLGVTAGDVPVDAATGARLAALATAGDLVINTSSDQPSPPLLRTAIELDCDYVDLGADPVSIAAMRGIETAAKKAGVRALVGAGWAPGTTNILARAAVDGLPGAEPVDVIVLLSLPMTLVPQRSTGPSMPLPSRPRSVWVAATSRLSRFATRILSSIEVSAGSRPMSSVLSSSSCQRHLPLPRPEVGVRSSPT